MAETLSDAQTNRLAALSLVECRMRGVQPDLALDKLGEPARTAITDELLDLATSVVVAWSISLGVTPLATIDTLAQMIAEDSP